MVSDCYEVIWDGTHRGGTADLFRQPDYQREETPFIPESHAERVRPITITNRIEAMRSVLTDQWQGVSPMGAKVGLKREAARRALAALETMGEAESIIGKCHGTPRLFRRKA